MSSGVEERGIEHLLRQAAPQVLGAVMRRYRDFSLAEDAVQEAMLAASQQWPKEGVPDNAIGWLIQVASRRMVDLLRKEQARRRWEAFYDPPSPLGADSHAMDDTLQLLFLCCHPALSAASAVALTLRAVGGLSTAQIARAYMVPEATMAQRISRAKQSIQTSRIPFSTQEARLVVVMEVLYLIFNEGYSSSLGETVQRVELAEEAIRLARLLRAMLPGDTEVMGLLALMLLTHARRAARSGALGELIPLTKQDRSLWDRGMIAEGVGLLEAALPQGQLGPYQVQAAVAAVHDEAARVEDTDWAQIVGLYEVLFRFSSGPMARLNHAVAVAMWRGAQVGLELVAGLEGEKSWEGSHRLAAVKGHLLELAGEREPAVGCYLDAARRTGNLAERSYLLQQAARLRDLQKIGDLSEDELFGNDELGISIE